MAANTFLVKIYEVMLADRLSMSWGSTSFSYYGMIECSGEANKFIIYFLHDDSAVPDAVYKKEQRTSGSPANRFTYDQETIVLFLKNRSMNDFVDLLRNENPLYVKFNPTHPGSSYLHAALEAVGDGES